MGPKTRRRVIARFLEFFIVGLMMGVVEDLLAIRFATDAQITPYVFKVAFLVALPFAIISELIVDFKLFRKLVSKNNSRGKKR